MGVHAVPLARARHHRLGVLSPQFLNDTVVLMLTPLTLEITAALTRNPSPYVIGLVTAAGIGSTATTPAPTIRCGVIGTS